MARYVPGNQEQGKKKTDSLKRLKMILFVSRSMKPSCTGILSASGFSPTRLPNPSVDESGQA